MGWLFSLGGLVFNVGKFVGGLLTGGNLDSVLRTIEKGFDDEVTKEQVKADVTKKLIEAQAGLLTGRTWWFQLFFVIPLGTHWAALCYVSAFPHLANGWVVHPLPAPFDEWAGAIIGALFIVDGGKALIGRALK